MYSLLYKKGLFSSNCSTHFTKVSSFDYVVEFVAYTDEAIHIVDLSEGKLTFYNLSENNQKKKRNSLEREHPPPDTGLVSQGFTWNIPHTVTIEAERERLQDQ